MSATLKIINTVSMEADGDVVKGRHGRENDTESEPLEFSAADEPFAGAPAISGAVHKAKGTLGTGAGVTLWDEDDDTVTTWKYMWLKVSQVGYVQLIGATTNVSADLLPFLPFTWHGDTILAAADTTPLAAEPTLEAIDSVRIWNESGNDMKYEAMFFN